MDSDTRERFLKGMEEEKRKTSFSRHGMFPKEFDSMNPLDQMKILRWMIDSFEKSGNSFMAQECVGTLLQSLRLEGNMKKHIRVVNHYLNRNVENKYHYACLVREKAQNFKHCEKLERALELFEKSLNILVRYYRYESNPLCVPGVLWELFNASYDVADLYNRKNDHETAYRFARKGNFYFFRRVEMGESSIGDLFLFSEALAVFCDVCHDLGTIKTIESTYTSMRYLKFIKSKLFFEEMMKRQGSSTWRGIPAILYKTAKSLSLMGKHSLANRLREKAIEYGGDRISPSLKHEVVVSICAHYAQKGQFSKFKEFKENCRYPEAVWRKMMKDDKNIRETVQLLDSVERDFRRFQKEDVDEVEITFRICANCGKKNKRMKKCGQCKIFFYCSLKCQKSDWKKH